MKIDKIKKYNQKILAILGTLAIILLIISAIGIGGIVISEYLRSNDYDDVETGILSDEKIEELQKENKREQIISYENPKLIDTLNSIYIIPVSHKNLFEAEALLGLLNVRKGSYTSEDNRYSRQFYGAYNNLIIYNQKSELTHKLFDKRVNFSKVNVEYFDDEILLLFNVSEKDTYKDGVINLLDFKSLYVYSIKQKKLKKIGIEAMDVYSYKFLNESKNLIISFGIDKNKDGKYDELNEPSILKKYNFETEKLSDVIGEKINSELQKMLEGTEK